MLALFYIAQLYITNSTKKTEEQPYKVIQKDGDFEIRFYPSATMATVTSSAKSYKELGNAGFRKLAGFIFGGNDANKQIAMTAPVHMDINDSISTMSFVMPANYDEKSLPKPNDPNVKLSKTDDEYAAVLQFSGFASDKKIEQQTMQLKALLKANKILPYGNYRYLGYNPPYQLFDRKNEIIVSIQWQN